MEQQKHNWSKWIAAFVFAVAVITVYKTFDNITNIFSAIGSFISLITPFIIGIVLAFFLYPACRKLEDVLSRSKYPRIVAAKKGLSVLIVYAAFLLVLILGISLLMPRLSASITEFLKRLPGYMEQIHDYLRSLTLRDNIFGLFDTEEIVNFLSFENLYSMFFRGDWGLYINGVIGVTSTLMSWLMGIIICVYTLLERDSLFRMSRKLAGIFIKEETINKIGFYVHEISSIFYNFFFGKAIDSLIIGIIAIKRRLSIYVC
jgi:predicted PurR-regulated permease PerM